MPETEPRSTFSTQEVADILGVHKNTLLNWIKAGKVPDAKRDWKRYRVWTATEIKRLKEFKDNYAQLEINL